MKRVKLQPRQHTLVCNDEEIECILDALEYYTIQKPSEQMQETREGVFIGANPIFDTVANVITELGKLQDRQIKFKDWTV